VRRLAARPRARSPRSEDRAAKGWTALKNGELLALASAHFDEFVTVDRNLSFQQDMVSFPIAVVVLHARTNRLADLRPLVPTPLSAKARQFIGFRATPANTMAALRAHLATISCPNLARASAVTHSKDSRGDGRSTLAAKISSHRRRPVPLAAMDPGLRREDKE
jgi:hypothetical protein